MHSPKAARARNLQLLQRKLPRHPQQAATSKLLTCLSVDSLRQSFKQSGAEDIVGCFNVNFSIQQVSGLKTCSSFSDILSPSMGHTLPKKNLGGPLHFGNLHQEDRGVAERIQPSAGCRVFSQGLFLHQALGGSLPKLGGAEEDSGLPPAGRQ